MTDARPDLTGVVPIPTFRGSPSTVASDLVGVDPWDRRSTIVVIGVRHWTLLLFLSAHCDGCMDIWGALSGPPDDWPAVEGVRPVVVARDLGAGTQEDLRRLSTPGVPLLISDSAFGDYRVHGAPFFALVDGPGGRVATEGVAWGAQSVAESVARARAGKGGPDVPRLVPREREG